MILFLIIAGFIAAFIDSVVGGGGLISLPALLFTGMSPAQALGTNKLASSMGSFTSMLTFMRSGKVNLSLVAKLFPLSLIGSAIGAYIAWSIPSEFLEPIVLILLVFVAIYTIKNKNWGRVSTYGGLSKKSSVLIVLAAFVIGFYDGFLGPGTGSFLLFSFLLLGFDFVESAGNTKVLNFASNLAALVTFSLLDSVHMTYGLIMGASMVVGAFVGARFAIRQGVSYIRVIFITITVIFIGKNLWDYFM
ncbi:sulfite exporter TauE/SafE family protein [Desertibacillus haloalkaliphilus]|uniref:sulfite exporter TauE/SafE family protein n=1 Tax=Desertibacillus haloalkaliphilus TaxID=1328930 RepID=UPI001C252724|nr:TSUP family transporter [Desertibacillus haloalkaliphilus]MBU8906594.1 TSUP family transporter [Desertibacillus haloalkaliphilus]